eukprot:3636513-Rhodomonas_salina.1
MSVGQAHNTSLPEGDGRALVWQRSWGPRGGQSSSGLGVLGVFPKRLPPAVSAVGVKCSLTSHSHLRCLPLLRNLQDPAMDPASAFLRPARTLVLHLTELQLQQALALQLSVELRQHRMLTTTQLLMPLWTSAGFASTLDLCRAANIILCLTTHPDENPGENGGIAHECRWVQDARYGVILDEVGDLASHTVANLVKLYRKSQGVVTAVYSGTISSWCSNLRWWDAVTVKRCGVMPLRA